MSNLRSALKRAEINANRWAATHGAPHITRQGWAIVASIVLGFLGLLLLSVWVTWHFWPRIPQWEGSLLNQEEKLGPVGIIAISLVLFALNVFIVFLGFLGRYLRKGRLRIPYVKFFAIYLGYLAIAQLVGYFVVTRISPTLFVRHQLYVGVFLRTDAVLLLTAFALFLYWFKSKTKILYGFSEILIAILSNLALIGRIDLSHIPQVTISWQDGIAMGAFTYLLSRGITNVIEGASVYRDRFENLARNDSSPVPTPGNG